MRLKDILNNTTVKKQEYHDSNPDLTPKPNFFPICLKSFLPLRNSQVKKGKILHLPPIPETPVSNH